MSDALAPIADKLRRLVRMLSSDQGGEVIAAAQALTRTLKSRGLDIPTLADNIGRVNGGQITEAEMRELYDTGYAAGVEDGRRESESNQHISFHNVTAHDEPSWHDIACECRKHPDRLHDAREKQFVADMC